MGRYVATRTYEHSRGLSCAYRIWKSPHADRFMHGHSLEVKMVFECLDLDASNQVVSFAGFKPIDDWLIKTFSSTTCVAEDDPLIETFQILHYHGAIDIRIVPEVGVSRFAEMIWHKVFGWLRDNAEFPRVRIKTVEVRESNGSTGLYLE